MTSMTRTDGPPSRAASAEARARRARRRHALLLGGVLAPVVGLGLPWVVHADSATEARYPFDPACPWGRLANGKGMITRCLGEEEARALLAGGTFTTHSGTQIQVRGIAEAPSDARPSSAPSGSAPSTSAPTSAAPATPTPTESSPEPVTPTPETPARPVKVEVGPIIPDEGQITIGQLGKPIDRYRACVEQNGGLTGKSGEVRVHFLVRGERGRAEGVEVTEAKGVTKKAAQCIADVVDRRATGTPSQPLVGATLVFKISS